MQAWLIEIWVELALGIVVILARIFTRIWIIGGPKYWSGDDYLIVLGLALIVGATVSAYESGVHGINLNYSINEQAIVDMKLRKSLEYGSKANFADWILYTGHIWTLKGCMLFFYTRLCDGLFKLKRLKVFGVLVFLTWIAVMLSICLQCRPIQRFWQVVPQPGKCVRNLAMFIVVGITNVFTDLLLLSIPIPLLWRAQFPLRRKIFLAILLCGGVAIIAASLCRTILSLVRIFNYIKSEKRASDYKGYVIAFAYREMLVANIVVNAPIIAPLFNRQFWWGRKDGSVPSALLRRDSYGGKKVASPVTDTFNTANLTIISKGSETNVGPELEDRNDYGLDIEKEANTDVEQSNPSTSWTPSQEPPPIALAPDIFSRSTSNFSYASTADSMNDRPALSRNSTGGQYIMPLSAPSRRESTN